MDTQGLQQRIELAPFGLQPNVLAVVDEASCIVTHLILLWVVTISTAKHISKSCCPACTDVLACYSYVSGP